MLSLGNLLELLALNLRAHDGRVSDDGTCLGLGAKQICSRRGDHALGDAVAVCVEHVEQLIAGFLFLQLLSEVLIFNLIHRRRISRSEGHFRIVRRQAQVVEIVGHR